MSWLEHSLLPLFEKPFKSILRVCFTTGLSALSDKGFRFDDITSNEKARSVFMRACHAGYDKAQNSVGLLLIKHEELKNDLTKKLKEARRQRAQNVPDLVKAIKTITYRQLVLRNIINSLLLMGVGGKHWIARSMVDGLQIRNIDITSLKKHLSVAERKNKESRYRFYIVSDITTCVDYGDFIEVDPYQPKEKWKIIEHKDGKVNEKIMTMLGPQEVNLEMNDEQNIMDQFGEKGLEQAKRMVRQDKRLHEVKTLIKKDFSEHETHGGVARGLMPDEVEIGMYTDVLVDMFKNSYSKPFQARTIDECLHLIVVSKEHLQEIGMLGVYHAFYHMANRSVECKLDKGEQEALSELEVAKEIKPVIEPILNNLKQKRSEPFFSWVDPIAKYTVDILAGRIRLFAFLDMDGYIKLVESNGLKFEWMTRKESEGVKKHSQKIPGSPDAYGFKIIHPDGFVSTYMSGMLARIILYYFRPTQLIKAMKKDPEQWKKLEEMHSEKNGENDKT